MKIGILGLQGCYEPHRAKLAGLGVEAQRVVYPADLDAVDGLILPGGESTTMLKTAKNGLWEGLLAFGERKPVWGVCAGCILMASEVHNPRQPGLGLLDIEVTRNAYGAQLDSFIAQVEIDLAPTLPVRAIFIRAPRITHVGEQVRVLATYRQDPIMVEGERHLVTTFHPELAATDEVHAYFLRRVQEQG